MQSFKTRLCISQLINFQDFFSHMTAIICKHTPPLGPLPNDEIDVKNLDSLEKYRSYTPYLRQAEKDKNKQVWWKTYWGYVEKADPSNGEGKRGDFPPLTIWKYYYVFSQGWTFRKSQNIIVVDVERVDIGLPFYRPCRTIQVKERKQVIKDNKKNVELERALRRQTCKFTVHSI